MARIDSDSKTRIGMKPALLAALIGVGAMLSAGMGPRIEREGDQTHRDLLSELETQPFPAELFAGLDGWTHGQVLDSESIKDKVVLVGLISVDNPKSMMVLSSMARYERQNKEKGLVVLAVHPEQGWDVISQKVEDRRVKVQVARDVDSAFAAALHADDYPDLFMIDRAGQLRYADFESKSLKAAVSGLIRETEEEAIANAQSELLGIEIASEEEKKDTVKEVDPAAYNAVSWPSHNSGKLKAKNYQGKALPVPLGGEEWITDKKDLTGKVIVLDFWATWCGPCRRASPMLDQMQKTHEGKLEVLAIGGQSEDERTVRKYVYQSVHSYSHLYDRKQSIYRKLEIKAIPHTVIMSTDGVIRWQGNPLSPAFKTALEQVLSVDPMIAED